MSSGDNEDAVPDVTEAVTLSIDIMQGAIARLKLAAYTPDKIIQIPRQSCSFFEFNRAEEMAQLGYKNTCAALDEMNL